MSKPTREVVGRQPPAFKSFTSDHYHYSMALPRRLYLWVDDHDFERSYATTMRLYAIPGMVEGEIDYVDQDADNMRFMYACSREVHDAVHAAVVAVFTELWHQMSREQRERRARGEFCP